MKQLILGNEAVARGLYEAGCMFVSSYPGTPSTEISEYLAKYDEVVFCGYGEPTLRLDTLLEVAKGAKALWPAMPIRINTNGLSAIAYQGSNILLLDYTTSTITVYKRTAYGDLIVEALQSKLDREYDKNFAYESVIWDFIGGEPFMEAELIDKICNTEDEAGKIIKKFIKFVAK